MQFVLIIHRSKVLKKLTRTTLINLSTQITINLSTQKLINFKPTMNMTLHPNLIFFHQFIFYKILHIQQRNVKSFLMIINLMIEEIIGYEVL